MKSRDLDRLFSGLDPAPPPPETRDRALAAARAANSKQEARADVWSRLWRSRPARLAWAAAVTALVIANLALSLSGPDRPAHPVGPTVIADSNAQQSELAAIARLPRIRLDVLPLLGTPRGPAPPQEGSSNRTPRRQS